jgi:CheY-like chemotaxis protein
MDKILLVDDEERLLRNLEFFFEDEGYEVRTATSGEEAIDIMKHEKIDACVVDMRLPGIDGNEVIRCAVKNNLLDKFIIHTGSTDYGLPADLRDIGFSSKHVFLKPVPEMSILTNAIHALLENKL